MKIVQFCDAVCGIRVQMDACTMLVHTYTKKIYPCVNHTCRLNVIAFGMVSYTQIIILRIRSKSNALSSVQEGNSLCHIRRLGCKQIKKLIDHSSQRASIIRFSDDLLTNAQRIIHIFDSKPNMSTSKELMYFLYQALIIH